MDDGHAWRGVLMQGHCVEWSMDGPTRGWLGGWDDARPLCQVDDRYMWVGVRVRDEGPLC